jgi:hypothetical protein
MRLPLASDRLRRLLARSRRRRALIAGGAALLALAAASATVLALSGEGGAKSQSKTTSEKTTEARNWSRCQAIPGPPNGIPQAPNPRTALRLKPDSLARAVHPALRWNRSLQSRVTSASFHSGGWTIIREMCGRRVYRRTIYVVVHHPHTGTASLAVSKLFIARFPGDRYRIWYFVHS